MALKVKHTEGSRPRSLQNRRRGINLMHKPLNARLAILLTGAALLLPTAAACAGEGTPAGEQPPAGEQGAPAGEEATPTPGQQPPAGQPGGDIGQAPVNIVGLTDDNRLVEFSS